LNRLQAIYAYVFAVWDTHNVPQLQQRALGVWDLSSGLFNGKYLRLINTISSSLHSVLAYLFCLGLPETLAADNIVCVVRLTSLALCTAHVPGPATLRHGALMLLVNEASGKLRHL